MTEGALVFASIIVGLAVTDILASLHRLLRVRRLVRWSLLNLAMATFVLLTLVQVWWGIAGQPASSVTIGAFLPVLVTLVLMFLLAAAVLPDEVPPDGLDLRDHYWQNASYLWTLFAAGVAWNLLVNLIQRLNRDGDWRAAIDSQAGDVPVILLMLSLVFVRRGWWHAAALSLLSLIPLIWLGRTLS